MSGQQSTVWQNKKLHAKDTRERLKKATKETTQKLVSLSFEQFTGTQQGIVDDLIKKYMLNGNGRDGSRGKTRVGGK